jgi:hypothetical protein
VAPGGGFWRAVEAEEQYPLDLPRPSPAIHRIASFLTDAGLRRVRVDPGVDAESVTVMGQTEGDDEDSVRASIVPLLLDAIESEFPGVVIKPLWLGMEA